MQPAQKSDPAAAPSPATQSRFIKLGASGEALPADAAEWVAVLDNTTNLIWDASEHKPVTWKKACERSKSLSVCGFSDWRLPTVEELFLLADRTKFDPTIDTSFFPACERDCYWTSTPLAPPPGDYAWCVTFSSGSSGYGAHGGLGLVRAVRPRQ